MPSAWISYRVHSGTGASSTDRMEEYGTFHSDTGGVDGVGGAGADRGDRSTTLMAAVTDETNHAAGRAGRAGEISRDWSVTSLAHGDGQAGEL